MNWVLIIHDLFWESLGQKTQENATWWKFRDSGCHIKLQLISIDILVFGSFAKIRPYLALEPVATSMDVLQRFLPLALSSFILVNIKISAQKTENELLIFQYCLNLQLNWRSVYVFLSKTGFCYSLWVSDTKLSSRERAEVLFRQSTKGEYATQHFQIFSKENWGMVKTNCKVIGLDVRSFTEKRGKREKERKWQRKGGTERERKGQNKMNVCHCKTTNKLSL